MQAVAGKHDQHGEIRDQNRPVEKYQVMDAGERIVKQAESHRRLAVEELR